MKTPLINKLGTLLNTVGSLGTGYFICKFEMISDPYSTVMALTPYENVTLFGFLIMLAIGLTLRVRDLFFHRQGERELARQLSDARARLGDLKGILDIALSDLVNQKVREALAAREQQDESST